DRRAQADRSSDDARANAAQTLLFWRLEKLLKVGQHVFRNSLEVIRRAHLANLVGDCHPALLPRRDCRLRDGVGIFERIANDAEVRTAGTAELAQLSFLRSAGGAVHIGA